MSKHIDYIIDEIRESTENEEFDSTIGLTEEEILKFINHGMRRLHSKIVAQHPSIFLLTEEQDIVSNQEAYTLDHKAYLGNKVTQIEYSFSGSADDYYPLRPASLYNRDSGANGSPCKYIRKGGGFLLLPTPDQSGGKLRITYVRKSKRLDKRRGQIKAITTVGSAITNLEINYVQGSSVDNIELLKRTRFCVVDKYGNLKMENILLSSIDTSVSYDTTLAVDSSFAFQTGETIVVDDYIIPGEYTTTHFELGEEVERYLHAYAEWKVLKRDSSVDSQEALIELSEMERDIIASYADISDDIIEVPEINDTEDWGF